jgi:hypothetical protein
MLADVPPQLPPLTPPEAAHVMCLNVATTLRHEEVGQRMFRVYLSRLRNRDHTRDWVRYVKPLTELPYGEFTAHAHRCTTGMRRRR